MSTKPKEFWINQYRSSRSVFDCVAHTTLERSKQDAYKDETLKQGIHTIEYSAYKELERKLAVVKDALDDIWAGLVVYSQNKNEEILKRCLKTTDGALKQIEE